MNLAPLLLVAVASATIQGGESTQISTWVERGGDTLRLTIKAKRSLVRLMEMAEVSATIKNVGRRAVTIVEPGDGSLEAWRTPIVKWSVLSVSSSLAHSPPSLQPQFRQCGSLSPLASRDIIKLRPGQSTNVGVTFPLDYYGAKLPGLYRIRFYYRNDPYLKWGDPYSLSSEMKARIEKTFPCTLASNELVVRVVNPKANSMRVRRNSGGIRP